MMYPNRILIPVTVLLIFVNFYFIANFDLQEKRWIRIISCAVFFLFAVVYSGLKRNLLTAVFGLLLTSNLIALYNELLPIRKINLALVIIAYLLLMLQVRPFVKKLKANYFQKGIFVLLLSLNLLLLFSLMNIEGDTINDFTQVLLLSLRGICIIGLIVLGFSYANRYSNTSSLFFLLAAIGLGLSDIFAFVSFHLEIPQFVYIDRFFYLIGLSTLARYTLMCRKEEFYPREELL